MSVIHMIYLRKKGSIELTTKTLMDYVLFSILLAIMLYLLAKGIGILK